MKNETKLYRVAYEVRQQGAIGEWQRRTVKVNATSEETATSIARLHLGDFGWETRSPLSVVEVNS